MAPLCGAIIFNNKLVEDMPVAGTFLTSISSVKVQKDKLQQGKYCNL